MRTIFTKSLLAISGLAISACADAQLFSQKNLIVRLAGSAPAASWITSGTPLMVGFGEATPGNADLNLMMASGTANARGVYGMKRARGTLAAPAAVVTNDQLGSLLVSGFDGTNFQGAAAVDFFTDGTPTAGNVPVRISFVTGTNSGNRQERLRIGNTGDIIVNNNQLYVQRSTARVGIGTLTPGGQFELSLDQARKPGTTTWTITSDARLKNIQAAYTKGLAEIMKLTPVVYFYKNVDNRKFDEKTIATQQVGFVAQDVQKVFPESVGTDDDGYLNLNYHAIIVAQVNAIKELKTQLNTQEATNANLQKQIDELKEALLKIAASKTPCTTSK